MRGRLPLGTLLPLVTLLVALAALLPLRLVLGGTGLAAGAVQGSVWDGRLRQAEWHGLTLGDLVLRLRPAALLGGRLRYAIDGEALSGTIWQGGGAGIAGLTGQLRLSGATPLPLASLGLDNAGLDWRPDGCRSASGEATLLLSGLLAGIGPLSGQPRCEAGRLLLPLVSADGRTTLTLRADGDGWTARLAVAGSDPAATAALLAAGFAPGPAGPVLDSGGRW